MSAYANAGGAKVRDHVELAVDIVTAYVSNNPVLPSEMPGMIAAVHAALSRADRAGRDRKPTQASIRKSVTHDALISFENGKPYQTLKRHLTGYGLTPETYRKKWDLPWDYPMVSGSHSARRSVLGKSSNFGPRQRKAPARLFLVVNAMPDASERDVSTGAAVAPGAGRLSERAAAE